MSLKTKLIEAAIKEQKKGKRRKRKRAIIIAIIALALALAMCAIMVAEVLIAMIAGVSGGWDTLDTSRRSRFENLMAGGGCLYNCGCKADTQLGGVFNGLDYAGNQIWGDRQIELVQKHQSVYEEAAGIVGIPWQVLPVLHLRETGLSLKNPNDDGLYQILAKHGQPSYANSHGEEISREMFLEQSIAAAEVFVAKVTERTLGKEYTLEDVTNGNPDALKFAFFGYNGRSDKYRNQAIALGFSEEEAKTGEGSPYVMNRYDAIRDPTVDPTKSNDTWGQIKVDYGPIVYPANTDYGAFVYYAALAGLLPNSQKAGEAPAVTFIGGAIGESVKSSLNSKLGAGSFFDTASGRTVAEGKAVLDGMLVDDNDGMTSVFVLELGAAPSTGDTSTLDAMLQSLSDKKVVLITPYVAELNSNRASVDATAEWMRGAVSTYPNVKVADWHKTAGADESLLSDGVMPTPEAHDTYIELVLRALGVNPDAAGTSSVKCACPKDCPCWDTHGSGKGDYGALSGPFSMRIRLKDLHFTINLPTQGETNPNNSAGYAAMFEDGVDANGTVTISFPSGRTSVYYYGYVSLPFDYANPIAPGYRVSSFAFIRDIEDSRSNVHGGWDIAAPQGTPILAFADGTITQIGYEPANRGYFVIISHEGGIQTEYYHMWRQTTDVTVGTVVAKGQKIGEVGTTGASQGDHLHFGIKQVSEDWTRQLVAAYYLDGDYLYDNDATPLDYVGLYVPPYADPNNVKGYYKVDPFTN